MAKYAKLHFRICQTGQKYAKFFSQQKTPGKLAKIDDSYKHTGLPDIFHSLWPKFS